MASRNNNFLINGSINTGNDVLSNLNAICNASGTWLTFDGNIGKWTVIINQPSSSIKSFTDSNIIGGINVSGTGIGNLYTGVSVQYPHVDLRNQQDFVDLTILNDARYPNEADNILTMNLPIINDPIQAQYIGKVTLNQNRLDKTVNFQTDYTSFGLMAGDVISITSSMYGYSGKQFRIIKLIDQETSDGQLVLNITALEYDPSIYSDSGLVRNLRTSNTGILPSLMNEQKKINDDNSKVLDLAKLLGVNVITGLLQWLTSSDPITGALKSILKIADGINEQALMVAGTPVVTYTGPSYICEGEILNLLIRSPFLGCGSIEMPYTITGVQAEDIDFPLTGHVTITNGYTYANIPIKNDTALETESLTFTIYCKSYTCPIKDQSAVQSVTLTPNHTTLSECEELTFTLIVNGSSQAQWPYTITGIDASDLLTGTLTGNFEMSEGAQCSMIGTKSFTFTKAGDTSTETIFMNVNNGMATSSVSLTNGATYTITPSSASVNEGDSFYFDVAIEGMVPGTTVPYTWTDSTGTHSDTLTCPSAGSAVRLNATSIQDNEYTGGETVTLIVGPTPNYGTCSASASITIIDDESECALIQVPLTWCANYNQDGQVQSLHPNSYLVCRKPKGSNPTLTVPLSVMVTPGNPSTVSVVTSTQIDSTANTGGLRAEIITSFNSQSAWSPGVGTTTTVYGVNIV